jgi:cystathionine gamma-synthase
MKRSLIYISQVKTARCYILGFKYSEPKNTNPMTKLTYNTNLSAQTLAAQALGLEDRETGAIVVPVHVATTYARDDDYVLPDGERNYIRDKGPGQEHVEAVITALEGGAEALSFGSGIAACTAAFHALNYGDELAVSDTIYHGVLVWLDEFARQRGLVVHSFCAGDLDDLERVLRANSCKLVWFETPANPTWAVMDIAAAADLAHHYGALLSVDSTCATPVLTQPINLGADIVAHSATKFLNGHSDVLAGLLVTAKQDALWERIRDHRAYAGAMLSARDAHMLTRGMRTLYLRVERQCENALRLAHYLEAHSKVEHVYYPGLANDPGHEVARRQMKGGFGGMLSLLIPGGREEAIAVARKARVFKRATSLGGVESLLEHRKTSESEHTKTPENLIRVSVGIESIDDLIADWEQMLG